MGRMAPKFTDTERDAIARAINAGGLTAVQATELARQGELAGLPAFEMADSTARDVAAKARRAAPEAVAAERAQIQDQLFEAGVELLTRQFDRLMEVADERDLNAQELTRMAKMFRALNVLVEGRNAQRLRQSAAEPPADDEPAAERSETVERMLAAMDD